MAVDVKKGDGQGWVGRSIRRVEDPTLVAGNGRFTGDLPAARWVRFVRSSVAAGRIKRIAAPEGATVITAADLSAVRPIQPMLHKFNYVPISQPVLAKAVVRFVGEPIAAVVALDEGGGRRHCRSRRGRNRRHAGDRRRPRGVGSRRSARP